MPKASQHNPTDTRVSLRGHVGSPDASNHSFLLLSPHGQSLPVLVPQDGRLPPVGSEVSVTGLLRFDEKEKVTLEMTSRDAWTQISRLNVRA